MLDGITLLGFGASYLVAWLLELLQLVWPRLVQRLLSRAFGAAGLLAHTLYLAHHFFLAGQRPLSTPSGSMLFLAWILAIFYLYGSIHHRKQAWGVFVLPLVAGLVGLAAAVAEPTSGSGSGSSAEALGFRGEALWGTVHGGLLLLAAVGISVGCVASLMYLVQAHRLKAKVLPGRGLRLLSLERLEEMNRRAINWAFPLLTAGVLVGAALMIQGRSQLEAWTDPRVLGAALLWLLFALLLYLRYGVHLQGRRLALLTIAAFALMLFTLTSAHSFVPEVGR
jgi:ABC-type transport system involved in cytochrome c biogenesis permease subunit